MGIESVNGTAASYHGAVESVEPKTERTVRESTEKQSRTGEQAYTKAKQRTDSVAATDDPEAVFGVEEQKQQLPNQTQIKKAIEEINRKAHNSEAIFGIHEDTNRVTIKIIDKDSKEVLREYPPEKTLDMIAKVWEMAGLMVDQKL